MISRIVVLFVLALLCSVGAATAKDTKDENAAVASAELWLLSVDKEQYADSWRNASEFFKRAVTKEKWEQSMISFRKPLGGILSRKVRSTEFRTSLPGAPDGKYVVIILETSFKNKTTAIETITPMLEKDGVWRVAGYFIR